MRTWGPDGRLHTQESSLRRTPPCQHLSLGRPATRMSCEPWSEWAGVPGTQEPGLCPGGWIQSERIKVLLKSGPETVLDSRCELAGGSHLTSHQRVVIVSDADSL